MIGLTTNMAGKTVPELKAMLKKAQEAFDGDSEAARILKAAFAKKIQLLLDHLTCSKAPNGVHEYQDAARNTIPACVYCGAIE